MAGVGIQSVQFFEQVQGKNPGCEPQHALQTHRNHLRSQASQHPLQWLLPLLGISDVWGLEVVSVPLSFNLGLQLILVAPGSKDCGDRAQRVPFSLSKQRLVGLVLGFTKGFLCQFVPVSKNCRPKRHTSAVSKSVHRPLRTSKTFETKASLIAANPQS